MSEDNPRVLLALSPIVEQRIAPLLFGEQAAVTVAASLVELAALDRTLEANEGGSEALLVSADLADLTASLLSRARSHGLRLVGIATDEHDAELLRELPLDAILACPIDALALQAAVHSSGAAVGNGAGVAAGDPRRQRPGKAVREGTVLAVVGSRGAPGASELACSLAALTSGQWHALLVELDLLGDAGLALRLGSDASQGSLLALLRATGAGEPALGELLERWLVARAGWPGVLLAPAHPEQVIEELDQPGVIRAGLDALAAQHPLVIVDLGFLLAQPGVLGPVERCHREALVAADAVLLVLGARRNSTPGWRSSTYYSTRWASPASRCASSATARAAPARSHAHNSSRHSRSRCASVNSPPMR